MVAGLGCAILITSASEGVWPTLALKIAVSLRASSQLRTRRFGIDPRLLRPTAPLRTICTKLRSILPSSMTRAKTRPAISGASTVSAAQRSAGMSFMNPRSRA